MRPIILTTLFLVIGIISSPGQEIPVDTYCIKLKKPSSDKHFAEVVLDSIPTEGRTTYEGRLRDWSKLLFRFNEEPLVNSDNDIFRSITFGPFNNPNEVQLIKIEKKDDKVEVTVKLIRKLKDSTILVHKTILGTEVWNKFEEVSNEYFLSRPSHQSPTRAIHDGSTTVFEGYLSNEYHFLERHVMSITDPDLLEVNRFLFRTAGDIFGINCKKDTREN
jgi:hypothetical protein